MDIQELRVKNLRDIAERVGGLSKLADLTDKSASQISRVIGKNIDCTIGEKLARKIELKLIESGIIKEQYYLDKNHDEDVNHFQIYPLNEKTLAFLPMIIIESTASFGQQLKISEERYNMQMELQKLIDMGIEIENSAFINMADRTMEKTIAQGSSIVIDMSKKEIESGKIYFLKLMGKYMVRRIYKELDGLRLACDNVDCKIENPDIIVPTSRIDEVLEIVGRGMVVVAVNQL